MTDNMIYCFIQIIYRAVNHHALFVQYLNKARSLFLNFDKSRYFQVSSSNIFVFCHKLRQIQYKSIISISLTHNHLLQDNKIHQNFVSFLAIYLNIKLKTSRCWCDQYLYTNKILIENLSNSMECFLMILTILMFLPA